MDRLFIGICVVSALVLTACGGQNGGSGGSPSASSTSSAVQTQLQELNSIHSRQGDIDLNFSKVDAVDDFYLTPYVPATTVSGSGQGSATTSNGSASSSTSGSAVIDPPPPHHYVRVAGTGTFTVTAASNPGSSSVTVNELGATAVFSADDTSGAACLQTAQNALSTTESLDIQGEGIIVQIPYFYCPSNTMCAQPMAAAGAQFSSGVSLEPGDEANAIVSDALTISVNIALPIWIYPHVGVLYQTISSCTSGSSTAGNP